MATSEEVPCPRCDATGTIVEYCARDLEIGTNEVPEHTYEVHCPVCLGQGHIRQDPAPRELTDS